MRRRNPTLLLAVVFGLTAIVMLRGQTRPQRVPTADTGAISGVVVDAKSGKPLAGAIVSLHGQPRVPTSPATRQWTDGKGRFVFRNLPASDHYLLSASKPGYVDGGYGPGRSIVLEGGGWFSTARISLVRTSSISGTVTDERGEPIVGAYVRVFARVFVAGTPQFAAGPAARTDDRGSYRIPRLRSGQYVVVVPSVQMTLPASLASAESGATSENAADEIAAASTVDVGGGSRLVVGRFPAPPAVSGKEPTVYPIVFYPTARSIAEAAVLDIDGGEERLGVDIRLQPAAAVRVSGSIDGPPEAWQGLTLRLLPEGCEDFGLGSEAATTLVGDGGRFTFVNVPAGAYTIDARRTFGEFTMSVPLSTLGLLPRPPGVITNSLSAGSVPSASTGVNFTILSSGERIEYSGRTTLTVGARDVSNVSLTLSRGVTVAGRFVWEGARSNVPFVAVEPASGSASLARSPDTPGFRKNPDTFTITGLPAGEFVLRVSHATAVVKSISWRGRDLTYTPFDASTGRDFDDVVVTLTDKPAALAGTVRQTATAGEAETTVIVFPAERDQWTRYGFTPARIKSVTVTTTGSYQVTGLPAGDYFVIALDASMANGWQDPVVLEAMSSKASRVSLDWGESKAEDIVVVRIR